MWKNRYTFYLSLADFLVSLPFVAISKHLLPQDENIYTPTLFIGQPGSQASKKEKDRCISLFIFAAFIAIFCISGSTIALKLDGVIPTWFYGLLSIYIFSALFLVISFLLLFINFTDTWIFFLINLLGSSATVVLYFGVELKIPKSIACIIVSSTCFLIMLIALYMVRQSEKNGKKI